MKIDYTWIMSALTILTMWLAGENRKSAWIVGLINQLMWGYFIFDTKAWGLSPTCIVLTIVYIRNLYIREERKK